MMDDTFTYNDFIRYKTVPRETFLRLQNFIELLKKWQKTINLISASTISDIWIRHIIDSAQLIDYISDEDKIVDIGSGAGFPGLILAMLGIKNITLVESDARKAAFLREAARIANIGVSVINQRIEDIPMQDFSLITARGFASVKNLCDTLEKTLKTNHKLLLLKGKKYKTEIAEALQSWVFDYNAFPSISDKEGIVLTLHNVTRNNSHDRHIG